MDHAFQDSLNHRRALLADRALEGLGSEAEAELGDVDDRASSSVEPGVPNDSLELAAARFDRATMAPLTPMPADVADRLRTTLAQRATAAGPVAGRIAPAHASTASTASAASTPASGGRRWTLLRAAGGFAAAAAISLVAITALRERLQPALPASPTEARAALVSRATDLVSLRWQGTDHPDIRESRDLGLVGGEVVWSDAETEGFVRVCHLGINDPADGSYRLWIWNADDPDGPPVACATFDVSQKADFTVVPVADAASIDRPVRASITLVPVGTMVQQPDPADELLVARYRPRQPQLDDPGDISRG